MVDQGSTSPAPPLEYFDHDADIGVVGRGPSLEAAFEQAAAAMFGLMAPLDAFHPQVRVAFSFEEEDLELALVTLLNRLLAETQAAKIMPSHIRVIHRDGQWQAECEGSPWRQDVERGVEVKGATLTMASVARHGDLWEARCVVDV